MEYVLKPEEREYLESLTKQQKALQEDFERLNVAKISALNLILKQNGLEGDFRLSEDGSKLIRKEPEEKLKDDTKPTPTANPEDR